MSELVATIRRANRPPPPESSIAFRVATFAAVLAGLAACRSVGEITPVAAAAAAVAIALGMTFSHLTRARPWQWVKLVLAVAVLAVFVWFVRDILGQARAGSLASVEAPLAALFVWVQVLHSVDVPARRDLLFSLAASGALVAVAAAQAVDSSFAVFVAAWFFSCVVGLVLSWRSMSGDGHRFPAGTVVATALAAVVLAGSLLVLLPAPRAASQLHLPASLTRFLRLQDVAPGGLAGGAGGQRPATAGSQGGPTRVGGYLGFAGPLDTAVRGSPGNEVVMRVRATRPGYFLGMTYDRWTGTSWIDAPGRQTELTGSPFMLGPAPSGNENVQTFYVAVPTVNLIFATTEPAQVWFPGPRLFVRHGDSSIRVGQAMTPGTVYTVVSADGETPPAVLAADHASLTAADREALSRDLQLPAGRYTAVRALAQRIVAAAHASTVYGEVAALEHWMGAHDRYSTDIPPLLPGEDTVNQFLFHSHVGYCEQISTALAVMLRSIGVPAREAVGYVPGPFDPLSDLYEIQAKDAHAWVQVYFPGYGWQSFDPTAEVPLAPADPGAVLLSDLWRQLAPLPWAPIGAAVVAVAAVEVGRRRFVRRPRTFVEKATRRLETAAARLGAGRRAAETLGELVVRIDATSPAAARSATRAATLLEAVAYGEAAADPPLRRELDEALRLTEREAQRAPRRRRRRAPADGRPRPLAPAG